MTQSWKSNDKLGAMNIPKELELHSCCCNKIAWQKQLKERRAYSGST